MSRLKAEGAKDMYVFGSADLSSTFINHDLIDEYRIIIAPVILGRGTPLFKEGIASRDLSVVSTQQLSSGGVLLKLARKS
jgi:dihydrofolate reductase